MQAWASGISLWMYGMELARQSTAEINDRISLPTWAPRMSLMGRLLPAVISCNGS